MIRDKLRVIVANPRDEFEALKQCALITTHLDQLERYVEELETAAPPRTRRKPAKPRTLFARLFNRLQIR